MSMVDVGPVIFGSTYNVIQYMQTHGLLASSMVCQNCGVAMTLQARSVCTLLEMPRLLYLQECMKWKFNFKVYCSSGFI